jgi:hypothetical protein
MHVYGVIKTLRADIYTSLVQIGFRPVKYV